MKFSIGDISRLSGFSPSGIRFFEEAGVISPTRGKNEKYREYSLNDLQRILICRNYRKCGSSLQESVEMLKHADTLELKRHIASQTVCIRKMLAEKQALLEFLDQQSADIDNLAQFGNVCRVMRMPALYWLKLWQPGDDKDIIKPCSLVYEWLEQGPFVNSCLILPQVSLIKGKGALETQWGIAIEERFSKMLNLSPKAKLDYIPSCDCIRVIITLNDDLTISASQLSNVRECIVQNGYKVTGPALSRFFYSVLSDGKLVRYDHLWIPIDAPSPHHDKCNLLTLQNS